MADKTKNEKAALSTSFSDLLLAGAALYPAFQFYARSGFLHHASALSFVMVGFPAFLGVFRFLGIGPVRPFHEFFAVLGAGVGAPFMAVLFCIIPNSAYHAYIAYVFVALAIAHAVLGVAKQSNRKLAESLSLLLGALCLFAMLGRGVALSAAGQAGGYEAVGGVACLLIAALGITDKGPALSLAGVRMPRIDAFHYALFIAYLFLGAAFRGVLVGRS